MDLDSDHEGDGAVIILKFVQGASNSMDNKLEDDDSDGASNVNVSAIDFHFLKDSGCSEEACIDSSAQRTVIGKQQTDLYSG